MECSGDKFVFFRLQCSVSEANSDTNVPGISLLHYKITCTTFIGTDITVPHSISHLFPRAIATHHRHSLFEVQDALLYIQSLNLRRRLSWTLGSWQSSSGSSKISNLLLLNVLFIRESPSVRSCSFNAVIFRWKETRSSIIVCCLLLEKDQVCSEQLMSGTLISSTIKKPPQVHCVCLNISGTVCTLYWHNRLKIVVLLTKHSSRWSLYDVC